MRLLFVLTCVWVVVLGYTAYKVLAIDDPTVCLGLSGAGEPGGWCVSKEMVFYLLLGFNFLIATLLVFFRTYALAYRRLKKHKQYGLLRAALGIFWLLLTFGNIGLLQAL